MISASPAAYTWVNFEQQQQQTEKGRRKENFHIPFSQPVCFRNDRVGNFLLNVCESRCDNIPLSKDQKKKRA